MPRPGSFPIAGTAPENPFRAATREPPAAVSGSLLPRMRFAGEWKQGGGPIPLVFKRLAKAMSLTPPNRPQEPKRPYPYADEEIVVENKTAGLTLAGTLTLPAGRPPILAMSAKLLFSCSW